MVIAEIQAMGRRAVAQQLDTGDVDAYFISAQRLRAVLRETWDRETFDYLVNDAGHGNYALLGETTKTQFDRLIDVHLKGVYFLTEALLPLIADGGRIVNLSFGLTRVCYAAYAAVKSAVEVLTRYRAKELERRGITVDAVAPTAIESDFGGGAVRDNPEIKKIFAGLTALGRVDVPDDIGPMVASLLTEENRWVNAKCIEVSGSQRI